MTQGPHTATLTDTLRQFRANGAPYPAEFPFGIASPTTRRVHSDAAKTLAPTNHALYLSYTLATHENVHL